MSSNDQNLGVAVGANVYDSVAKPTASSNPLNPMNTNFVTEERGHKVHDDRQAARKFKESAGVVEGRPGIIEDTHIAPLDDTNQTDDWAQPRSTSGAGTPQRV